MTYVYVNTWRLRDHGWDRGKPVEDAYDHFRDDEEDSNMPGPPIFSNTWREQVVTVKKENMAQRHLALPTGHMQVARPFVYTYKDGSERRFDQGVHLLDRFMAEDPWVVRDFADGRISHLNGHPVHMPQDYGRVADHTVAARQAQEQRASVGGNKTAQPVKAVEMNQFVEEVRRRRERTDYDVNTDGPRKVPPSEAGSLNLVQPVNVVQHGHKVF